MLTREQMLETFLPDLQTYKPLVGFEYEIQCFEKDTLRPLGYDGPRGLGEVLRTAASLTGGELIQIPGDPPNAVTLPDSGQLSIEPGGQFEFSSAPTAGFVEAMDQFKGYLALLDELKDRFDLHFFYGGVNPVHTLDDIGLVTRKHRYQIMNDYYPRVGTMGRRMMRQTCSIQVSFDYPNRARGEELLRTALYIAPVAAALFSNAPYLEGKRTEYRSYRVPIWANTDPSRSGLLPGFTDPAYGFDQYLDHVLAAPMFFVKNGDDYVDARGMTFAQFNERGFGGRFPTLDDFVLHNSTIFNDVRLKTTVEVRTVDSQAPEMLPSVLAFLCGILFCHKARLRTLSTLSRLTEEEYRALPDQLAREGLGGQIGDITVKELLLDLLNHAALGLPTCFPDGAEAVYYLDRVRDMVYRGKTPADYVLERFGDDATAWLKAGKIWW